jgi:SHAQKYF class myb-like DNA-binding protein
MISPVAVVSEDVSDPYPDGGRGWQGDDDGGEKNTSGGGAGAIPSLTTTVEGAVASPSSIPPPPPPPPPSLSSFGKLSPVISHPDLPSDAAANADDGGDDETSPAVVVALAHRDDGSLSDANNARAVPFVDDEPPSAAQRSSSHRPTKASSMDRPSMMDASVIVVQTLGPRRAQPSESGDAKGSSTSGRWTADEHEAFLRGLEVYGREWKKVATCVPTRTSSQIRSHAQKYFAKASREMRERETEGGRISPSSAETFPIRDRPMSEHYADILDSISRNPIEVEGRVCTTLVALRLRYERLEERLLRIQDSSSSKPPGSEPGGAGERPEPQDATMGPATAALELERKSLRTAAEARCERKRKRPPIASCGADDADPSNAPPCPFVSCASLKSSRLGAFDSSDVIALSVLGGNLGRERIENGTIRTIRDERGLNLVIERLKSTMDND